MSDQKLSPNLTDEQLSELTPEELIENYKYAVSGWKRAAAELDNFKKRKEQEGLDLVGFAKEMAVSKLLPSLQSLEQVLKFAPTDDKYKDWLNGLRATILQLEKAMEELGLKKIATLGEKFNPEQHEAVEEVPDAQQGIVAKEIQPGFMLNGRVIIPARVAVGKAQT